ncbi:MAG: hypothetical protein AAF616_04780 [Bacteroidota bacterium]
MKGEENWKKLHAYAHGSLSPKENQEIEEWLKANAEAKIVVKGYREITALMPNPSEEKAWFQNEVEIIKDDISKKSSNARRWLAAACILLAMGLSAVFIFQKQNFYSNVDELVSVYSREYYPAPFITRDPQNEVPSWILAYQEKKYQEVISLLSIADSKSVKEQFYLGMSYFYTSDTEQAIFLFQDKNLKNSLFSEQSRWYLALAHLQLENKEIGIEILNDIIAQEAFKHAEAKNLLSAVSDE